MQLKKTILTFLISVLTIPFLVAQKPTGTVSGEKTKSPSIERIYGKVLDSKTAQPVEFASVGLFIMPKDSAIAGALTLPNGDFSFDNIPFGTYELRVKFIGYKMTKKKVIINLQNLEKDLGNLAIEPDAAVLNAVVVSADKGNMSMSIDKKVYNVDKDLSVKGGTGLDALKNVPGVSVDNDGSVTLRNNSVQIYIDGKQTNLTLQQIPADQIEKIEVITNPSAKYDANTSGGILNIILKKNTQPNYNGSVIAGIGTGDRYTTTTTLNAKNQKFNFSGSYSFNTEDNYLKASTLRENITNPVPIKYFEQHSLTDAKRTNQMARLSIDYYLNNRNTITIGGTANTGLYHNNENQNYNSSDANNELYAYGTRNNNTSNHFNNYMVQAYHKKTFPKPGEELTTNMQYNYGTSGGGYVYTINNNLTGSTPTNAPGLQNNDINGHNQLFTFQSDFTNPINDSTKIEFGIKCTYKQSHNTNVTSNYSYSSNAYLYDSLFSNDYLINDLVNAAYINYNTRIKKLGIQGGLRFEQSVYDGKVLNKTGQDFGYSYPSSPSTLLKSIFPALFFSRKVNDKTEFQLNFTRKINRPNFFQMLPIVMAADNFNYRTGNPKLQPEFVNKAEINYNYVKQNINFLSALYGQYTENAIVYVSYPSSSNVNLLINTFRNGKGSFSYGWENSAKITLMKNLTMTGSVTPYYLIINYTTTTGAPLQASGYSLNTKLVLTYKLPKDFTFQANGTYEAPKPLAQGKTTDLHFFDLSISKNIKQRFFLNLTLSDVLNSKQRGSNYFTPDYTQHLMNRREARFLKFTATWMFGKTDTSKKKSNKNTKPGGDNSEGSDM
jgi:iron complex outermembrane recepter protein